MRTHLAATAALALAPLVWLACSSSSSPAAAPSVSPDAGDVDVVTADAAPSYDFSAMSAYLFGGSWKTDGVVVLVDGKLVFEQYANGYDAGKRHITYSASKSIGSALVGIAIGDGLMNKADSICTYVPAPTGADPTYCDTTIESLLQMSSGLTWQEDYTDPTQSNVLAMLYGDTADMGGYVAQLKRANKPGAVWNYSSGDANLLAKALTAALKGTSAQAWAKEKLFDPAGLTSAIFEADRSGTLVFSSSCFMTPRDMARFGELYRGGGSIDGKKVLPDGWVTYSITPAAAVSTPTPRVPDAGPGNSGGSYGAQWWLNSASATAGPDTFMYADSPVDTYSAEGHWGQKVYVVPSRKLVVARVGNDRDVQFDSGPMVGKAVLAVDAKGGK